MKIGNIKRNARQSLKGQWGLAILLMIISFGIYNFVPLLFEVIMGGGFSGWQNADSPWISIVSTILSFLLFPITIGSYWIFLSFVRAESANIEDLFKLFINGQLYLKSLGLAILVGIFTALWTLLFIIPGIIKSISYSQVYYILKDHPEYSITETITASRNMMKGYKWKFFLLQLSFIGWGVLCIFTLGIGLLWLVPYIMASTAEFYNVHSDQIENIE